MGILLLFVSVSVALNCDQGLRYMLNGDSCTDDLKQAISTLEDSLSQTPGAKYENKACPASTNGVCASLKFTIDCASSQFCNGFSQASVPAGCKIEVESASCQASCDGFNQQCDSGALNNALYSTEKPVCTCDNSGDNSGVSTFDIRIVLTLLSLLYLL